MGSYMQELQGEILHGCTMEQMKDLHSNSNWWFLKWGVSNTNPFVSLQMAKDVVSFLTWAAEPEADERKLVLLLFVLTLTSQCAHHLIVWCFLWEGRSPWTSASISVCLRSFNTNLLNAFEDAWNSVCLLLSLGFLSLPLMMVQKGHTIWGLCVLMKMLLHVCVGGGTQIGAKWIFVGCLLLFQVGHYKRWKWAPIKSRKLVLDVVNWSGMSNLSEDLEVSNVANGDCYLPMLDSCRHIICILY
jgi:hypothetical protein